MAKIVASGQFQPMSAMTARIGVTSTDLGMLRVNRRFSDETSGTALPLRFVLSIWFNDNILRIDTPWLVTKTTSVAGKVGYHRTHVYSHRNHVGWR